MNNNFNPNQLRNKDGKWTKTINSLIKKSDKILSDFNQLKDIRTNIDKSILDENINIGTLTPYMMKLLNTNDNVVRLSLDSLLKNRFHHPEIKTNDYERIGILLSNPDKVSYSRKNNLSILIFKYENKNYLMVIKSTQNKKENYLTSFRFFSDEEFIKY